MLVHWRGSTLSVGVRARLRCEKNAQILAEPAYRRGKHAVNSYGVSGEGRPLKGHSGTDPSPEGSTYEERSLNAPGAVMPSPSIGRWSQDPASGLGREVALELVSGLRPGEEVPLSHLTPEGTYVLGVQFGLETLGDRRQRQVGR